MFKTQFFTSYFHQLFFISCAWILGLLYSMEFVLSLSMISVVLCALFQKTKKGWSFRFSKLSLGQHFGGMKDEYWLMIPFLLVLVTAIYSTEDSAYLWSRLRIKIPYLILPLAFLCLPRISRLWYYRILYLFLILTAITSLGVLVNYIINIQEINNRISQGQPMPTPTSHIRFSLMVVLAIFHALILYSKKIIYRYSWERQMILGLGIFLVIFLHILSVRSGIAIFYLCAFSLLLRYVWVSKKYVWGLLAILGLSLLPVGAYHAFPSLENKVKYMIWDIQQYSDGNNISNSDSDRIVSLLVAKSIIEKQPVWGVGAGDVRAKVHQQYGVLYPHIPKETRKMPHNQYVSIWVGTGAIGLFFFLLGGIIPLWRSRRYNDVSFLVLTLLIGFSFLVENTIETAVGVAFHSLFLFLGMRVEKEKFLNDEFYSITNVQ